MPPPTDQTDDLAAVLARHLPNPQIGQAVAAVYERADRAIASLSPTCWNRGECCNFGRADHRLFVTTPELIYFAQTHEALRPTPNAQSCPHQRDGRCGARHARPLGCRAYFCQASARWWQPAVTEAFLAELRAVGARFGVPYAYTEWLAALTDLQGIVGCGPISANPTQTRVST